MSSGLPLTRRDVVALFVYVFLIVDVLIQVLWLLSTEVLGHLPSLGLPKVGAEDGPITLIHLAQLLLLPFVPVIAASSTGRYAEQPVTKGALRSFFVPCGGLVMCGLSLSQSLSSGYWFFAMGGLSDRASLSPLVYLLGSLFTFSMGFSVAFFPVIFDTLRRRVREDDPAS